MRLKHIIKVFITVTVMLILIPQTAAGADMEDIPFYDTYHKNMSAKNPGPVEDITISGGDICGKSNDKHIYIDDFEGRDNVLVWDTDYGYAEYEVNIKKEGFYNIRINYFPYKGVQDFIQRSLMIDGEFPFKESERFFLTRTFKSEYPFRKDEWGNHFRPLQNEVKEWKNEVIYDADAFYPDPLEFYFSKGKHIIRLGGLRNPVVISSIVLSSPKAISDYSEYYEKISDKPVYDGELITIEAEHMHKKTSTVITVQNVNEPGVVPEASGKVIYNCMGGNRWRFPGEKATWEVEIPEDGLYKFGMKYTQVYKENLPVYRRIEIDGEVLFKELKNVRFDFGHKWQNKIISDKEGEPCVIYLTEGRHTISLTVVSHVFRDITKEVEELSDEIAMLDEAIRKATGIVSSDDIDKYRVWNLEKTVPELVPTLNKCKNEIEEQMEAIKNIAQVDKNIFGELIHAYDIICDFLNDTESIPEKLDDLGQIQIDLLVWGDSICRETLFLDRLYLSAPDDNIPKANLGFIKNLSYSVMNFFRSFRSDYGRVGGQKKDALNVWVQRSRDYISMMQETADQYFTPQTGIDINVAYIPNRQKLIMANAAGTSPDISCGLPENVPFDFALRNALVNMGEMPGYNDVIKQFVPGSLVSYHYNGGDYALPETIELSMLFYRTDIIEKIGVEIPKTWDDVRDLIPTLELHGYKFNYPRGDFLTFYYQKGLQLYSENGLELAVDSPEGYQVFKDWCELYTVYGMPVEIRSFYQHFRIGDVPIGIARLNDYITLTLAAPDILGKWKMTPIPGTIGPDGELKRWQGGSIGWQGANTGSTKAVIIFKSSDRHSDAWDFVKWWMSTDTQSRFGNDIENYYGKEFRWWTANREALKSLPWSRQEREVLAEQLKWFKELPYVPGGYFTPREFGNAWTRVVMDKDNMREEFEITVEVIEKELRRKQEEFNLVDEEGNVIDTLDFLEVPEPE